MEVTSNKRFTLEGKINNFNLAIQSQNTQDSYHRIKKTYLSQNISFSKNCVAFWLFLVQKIWLKRFFVFFQHLEGA